MVIIQVEVVLDTLCPWCYIGKRNLDHSIELFRRRNPGVEFNVVWRPFYLYPRLEASGHPKSFLYESIPPQIIERIHQLGAQAGITFDLNAGAAGHSRAAHTMLRFAAQYSGRATATTTTAATSAPLVSSAMANVSAPSRQYHHSQSPSPSAYSCSETSSPYSHAHAQHVTSDYTYSATPSALPSAAPSPSPQLIPPTAVTTSSSSPYPPVYTTGISGAAMSSSPSYSTPPSSPTPSPTLSSSLSRSISGTETPQQYRQQQLQSQLPPQQIASSASPPTPYSSFTSSSSSAGHSSPQSRLLEALFVAHFERGQDISSQAVLVQLAEEVAGIPRNETTRVLSDPAQAHFTDVEAAEAKEGSDAACKERCCRGSSREPGSGVGSTGVVEAVPTFTIQGRWRVGGMQPAELLLGVFERAVTGWSQGQAQGPAVVGADTRAEFVGNPVVKRSDSADTSMSPTPAARDGTSGSPGKAGRGMALKDILS